MNAAAKGVTAAELDTVTMQDGCDPQVTAGEAGIVVTMYGRPFQLSERAARMLALQLIAAIEEIDRSRRF